MGGSPIPPLSRRLVKTRDRGRCLRCGSPTRYGEWHHRRSRSVKGLHRHSACNGVWLCHTCHRQVHKQPLDAKADGFIVSRYVDNPGEVPVKAWHGWVLLDDHGFFTYVDPPGEVGPEDRGQESTSG